MLPKVTIRRERTEEEREAAIRFPLGHISYSTLVAFSTNPVLFKIKYLNGDRIDTATGISGVIGKAFHRAMEVYYDTEIADESEAIAKALEAGMEYLNEYEEGWINWSKTIDNRQAALEKLSCAIQAYVQYATRDAEETIMVEEQLKEQIDVEYRGERLKLPVALKGYCDRVTRDEKGRLKIRDYKTTSRFSNLDRIDGRKILQAVEYYLLVAAATGETPYSMIYEEVKLSKNKDGSPQVREYEIVFDKHALFFDFYFRFYTDVIRGINGEMVYVPNIDAFFDNEVAIVAYLQRLDVSEQAAKLMQERGVSTITELLQSEIHLAGDMRELLASMEDKLATGKSINYETMTSEDKIKTKLLEHGMVLNHVDTIEGPSVNLYRFQPSMGIKMRKLKGYVDDVQQVLGAPGVRILSPIPGTTLVGFEVPKAPEDRRFPDLPACADWNLAIGETVDGQIRRYDIREAPHMLVAGSTGSGKSVFLHSIIRQIKEVPNAELHLFDPKRVELAQYKADAAEYQHDPADITAALAYLVDEMERRYQLMESKGVRSAGETNMAYKVIIIDEFADIAGVQAGNEDKSTAMHYIKLLAQKGRAAGIHIILATQRASAKVVDGDIRVNFPCKAVFRMAKVVDSQVMLDEPGAEALVGKGDMLWQTVDGIERLQGYAAL